MNSDPLHLLYVDTVKAFIALVQQAIAADEPHDALRQAGMLHQCAEAMGIQHQRPDLSYTVIMMIQAEITDDSNTSVCQN